MTRGTVASFRSVWYALPIMGTTHSLMRTLRLALALVALGCGPNQPPSTPQLLAPAPAPPVATAGPATPSEQAPATPQLQLAAEQGVPLGSPPSAMFGYCKEKGGKLSYSVTSNQGWAFCFNLPPPIVTLSAVYCSHGLSEAANLCVLSHNGPLESKSQAAQSMADWIAALTRRLGPTSERTDDEAVWQAGDHEIAVSTELHTGTDDYSASVLYSSREGMAAFEAKRPEFPGQVGGFEFGADEARVRAECARTSGSFSLTNDGPAPGFGCVLPSIDSPLNIKVVAGYFCAERVCEISLTLDNRMNDALSLLSAKYGPGTPVNMPSGQCKAEARKHSWFWMSGDEITGWMRVTDDCGVIIFYNDAEGWKLRDGQYIQRKKTY